MTFSKVVPVAVLAFAVTGCTVLGLARREVPSLFTLAPTLGGAPQRDAGAQTILVTTPVARPAYDGARMVYVTREFEVQFFARHEWVAPPTEMLAPLLVEALERGGRFRVPRSSADVAAALRLETEIIALEQEFLQRPSQTRFALRAELVDVAERRVLATEEFEALEPAPSDDPYGGVVAANRAVGRVLGELAEWCAAHAPPAQRSPGRGGSAGGS
jgi:cholesterol transport system auxiliary component